jgi:hypothetical protein
MKAKEIISKYSPCKEAVEWLGDRSVEEMVDECYRGDWMLWLAQKAGIEIQPLTLAKARCAKTVLHLMKDPRSVKAVEVAEQFGLGNATAEELKLAAAAAAYATPYAYTDADADAADAAAYAAAAAAAAAAYAAAYAYAAAAAAAADAAAADAAYAAARQKNQKETADICREVFGEELKKMLK